jgi:class 3 adenylate cyclase
VEDPGVDRPETQFAWNGDVALAYQVLGEGDPDLVYLQGWISNVELNWDHPTMARFLRGLARSRRLVVTDLRGYGCSERSSPHDIWPLEVCAEDLNVVLDAVGAERAAILATNECGFIACMFAATYPERTAAVILYETAANWRWSEETPWEWTEDQFAEQEAYLRTWGTSEAAVRSLESTPAMADDVTYVEWWRRYCLLSTAPGYQVAAARKYQYTDIRPILPAIHVPVLVLVRPQHPDPSWLPAGRFLADRSPGARLAELPGGAEEHWLGDQTPLFREVDGFLGEVRREQAELDRVLATVLFTDIVGSTHKAAELGDAAWRALAERHHAAVRALLERFRGVEVDVAGDGFFATFDGPARAIRCAQAIVEEVRPLGVEIRAGVHTGECELIAGKVGGIAVNIGARIGASAAPSELLVSQTVKDLVAGSGLEFHDRGEHELKGIPGAWRLFGVHS